jgi:hypothetical protein
MSTIPELRTKFTDSINSIEKTRQQAIQQSRNCEAEILKLQGALAALDLVEAGQVESEVATTEIALVQPLPEEFDISDIAAHKEP